MTRCIAQVDELPKSKFEAKEKAAREDCLQNKYVLILASKDS
jgi:hypothetical protein